MTTIAELRAKLAQQVALGAQISSSIIHSVEESSRERQELIELAIKAVELGERLGADAEDAGPDQLLFREVRDGLVAVVRRQV